MLRLRTIAALTVAIATVAAATAFAEVPSAILENYLKIQGALAGDTTDGVRAAATALAIDARALGTTGAKTQQAASRLAAAKDLAGERAAFGDLSDALIALVGSERGALKKAYCPMVKKYWLQKGALIENPYYGSEMLRCGSFEK